MPLISERVLSEVLERCDIVEIISSYIPLKRAGRNFKANCPFHHEKTASFIVSPQKQIYHCFGCGAGGNVFNFLMRYEKLEFREAAQALAEKVGVEIQLSAENPKEISENRELYKINELAANFYHDHIKSKEASSVRSYLAQRGISAESVKELKIGYAPDAWGSLMSFLRNKKAPLRLQEKAGLILSKQHSSDYYDRFRSRVIFPIFDIKSRVVGFGGRILTDALPKYINSPETPVYSKGRILYGFNFSKDAIGKNDQAVIVEGYLDFLIPYQDGFKNIVASSGTALTIEQIRLLKRYTHNIVTIFDSDKAGEFATLRSLDLFIEEGMNVKVASLPKGFDPDLFVRERGIEEFKRVVSDAVNLFDYKLSVLVSRHDPKIIENRAKIAAEMLSTISRFKNAVLQSEYVKRLSDSLSVKEEALLVELAKMKDGLVISRNLTETVHKSPEKHNLKAAEKMILRLMLAERKFVTLTKDRLEIADFHNQHLKDVVEHMFDLDSQGEDVHVGRLVNRFAESPIAEILTELSVAEDLQNADKEKILHDCIQRLKKEGLKLKCKKLHHEFKQAENEQNEEMLKCLIEEYNQLIKG